MLIARSALGLCGTIPFALAIPAAAKDWGPTLTPRIGAVRAIETAKHALASATVTEPWVHATGRGVHLHVGVLAGGVLAGKLHLHPQSGAILSKWRARAVAHLSPTIPLTRVAAQALKAVRKTRIAELARLSRHGDHWRVELVEEGEPVMKMHIDSQTGAIRPDFKAEDERRRFASPLGR
jgi:hypothetical protein